METEDAAVHGAGCALGVRAGRGVAGRSGDPGSQVRHHPGGVRAFADGLGPADEVALEATGNTWAFATLLARRAGRVVVSNPVKTRAIAEAKAKTDKVDAQILA